MPKKNARITIEDLWKVRRPGLSTLSPDGAQVCVAVSSFDMDENKAASHLWLLSTFGGKARELTRCGENDGQPQWSPDGSVIAFVGKRGEGKQADQEPQLYLIAADGGEARRVTSLATGVSAIRWFADGKRLAFVSWVWPDLNKPGAQARRFKEKQDDKCKAHVVEHTQARYWDHWLSDGRRPHLHVVDVASGACRDLFAGSGYHLPLADPGVADYDIAPDGKHAAFCFNPQPDPRGDQPHHIVEMNVRTGKAHNLTTGSRLSHFSPAYSPDGRHIALLAQNLRRSVDDDLKVFLLDRKDGKLTSWSHWDRNVNAPLKWAADSASVYFAADEHSRLCVWRLAKGKKAPDQVVAGGTVTEFDVRGDTLVFVRNDMSSAPRVFAAAADGTGARGLETFNDALMAKFKLGAVKEFTFDGWNKEPVQMWVVYPPDFDPKKKWPMVHNIHGGPHANWGDNFHFRWNNHTFAAQGYVVVCVNYHGSLGWGNAFLESNNGTWGTKEHADIEAATDFMLKQGYIDRQRMAATGGSYGGKMVAWMNGRNGAKPSGDRYQAYVCHAGCYDWQSMYAGDAGYWFDHSLAATYWGDPAKVAAQNPASHTRFMKTPTLVMHGALDYRVPDAQGLMYYNALRSLGVPARMVFFPDENHWILKPQNSRLWYREYLAWLARYIGHGPTRQSRR